MNKIEEAISAAESLKLDPAASTTPHCIEEYNAGITNALATIRETLES